MGQKNDKNYSENISRAGWTENNKDKKEGIDNTNKTKLSGQFFCPDKRAFTTK